MGFSMATGKKKTSDNKETEKENRRANVDRRKFSYTEYIPERRSNKDRRKDEIEDQKHEKEQNR